MDVQDLSIYNYNVAQSKMTLKEYHLPTTCAKYYTSASVCKLFGETSTCILGVGRTLSILTSRADTLNI